jgi:hypothetical protein
LLREPCSAVSLDYLCTMVTMATKLFNVDNTFNHGNQVGLDGLCTRVTNCFTVGNHGNCGKQVFYCRAKTT